MIRNLIGKTFSRLKVIQRVENDKYGAARWKCLCDCGRYKVVTGKNLRSGHTKSCGCLEAENKIKLGIFPKQKGLSKTRIYKIWINMISRCENPKNSAYKNYGARGINVCDEWKEFINFYNWSKESGYDEHLTIERKDNAKGYSPNNCVWANEYEQGNNKRNNQLITINGYTKTIAEWSRESGIPYATLRNRFLNGWDESKILSPVDKSKRNGRAKI